MHASAGRSTRVGGMSGHPVPPAQRPPSRDAARVANSGLRVLQWTGQAHVGTRLAPSAYFRKTSSYGAAGPQIVVGTLPTFLRVAV
ncbi:hypothetical protein GCM10007320_16510 [Pseudorhodoferax aquiterrae]|uniref:Uncharacterized protein n=1 Tax=Pseudorhodoferax aquiterrae TaxID=747304 RepID=A0ABQ3FZ83_9BURK|nr:hypothetical protein GCM10007320_16510 [Pseudorhodoferax aquiterrae]